MTAPPSRMRPRPSLFRRPAFFISSLVMVLLCFKIGFLGNPGEGFIPAPWDVADMGRSALPAGPFILLLFAAWAAHAAMFLFFPRGLTTKESIVLLLPLALICRIALAPHEPSDDINRYLWEGRLIREGVNPYHHAPEAPPLAALAEDDPYHPSINHPDMPAAYPPLTLYLFSLAGLISYDPFMLKILMVFFDMGAAGFLLYLLHARGLDPRHVILYAFNPVVLYSFAGQAHFDSMQLFFLLGALWLHSRKRWLLMFLFAALAVQIKYVAIVAIPFLVNRNNIRWTWAAAAAILLPYAPLITPEWRQLFSSIIRFAGEFAFNGSIHGVLRSISGEMETATSICKALLAGALLFGVWWFHPARGVRHAEDPVPGCFFSLGAILLLSPTVHYWYIAWIAPFIALRFTLSWLVLCLSIAGYFVTCGVAYHTGEWRLPLVIQILQWLPFYALFGLDVFLFFHRMRAPLPTGKPLSVSVIIPARNEEKRIEACIEAIRRDDAVREVIVVDGGSSDRTRALAANAGAMVIQGPSDPGKGGGRGGQINAGLAPAKGDIAAVVHADALTPPGVFSEIRDILSRDASLSGGAIGCVFTSPAPLMRLVEAANDFRAVFLGISFGDQVQFFRREPVVRRNLFPPIPLMEDVEFSLKLPLLGRRIFLFGEVRASARRWEAQGYGNFISIPRRVAVYLWRRLRGNVDVLAMHRGYYGEGKPSGNAPDEK